MTCFWMEFCKQCQPVDYSYIYYSRLYSNCLWLQINMKLELLSIYYLPENTVSATGCLHFKMR